MTKAYNALVPVDSVGLGLGWNFLLSIVGEDSQVFWEKGKGSWVRFLCSLGSYPRSSGNGTLTIASYTNNSFNSFSSFHVMPFQALFFPLSSWMLNARKAEEPKPSGVSSNGSQGLLLFVWLKSLHSCKLRVYLQHPPSPVRAEKFWVRNYHNGWLPESINHTSITTLLFLPSLFLSSKNPAQTSSQASHRPAEVANCGLTAGHGNHQVHTRDCH